MPAKRRTPLTHPHPAPRSEATVFATLARPEKTYLVHYTLGGVQETAQLTEEELSALREIAEQRTEGSGKNVLTVDSHAEIKQCRKVMPDRTVCRQPAAHLTAEQAGGVSGLYHLDRSLTADHHAVTGGY